MNMIEGPRRATMKQMLIVAVAVVVAITHYAGVKTAVHDFGRGFQDGFAEYDPPA